MACFITRKSLFLILILTSLFSFSQRGGYKLPPSYEALSDTIFENIKIDSSKAISLSWDFINKARYDGNKPLEFRGYHILVMIYVQNGNIDKGSQLNSINLKFAKNNNLKEDLFKAYHLKSVLITFEKGFNDLSVLDNYYDALQLARNEKSVLWECKFLNDISNFYNTPGNIKKMISLKKEVISKIQKIPNAEISSLHKIWGIDLKKYYFDLSNAYITLKTVDSASHYNSLLKEELYKSEKDFLYYNYYQKQIFLNQGEINLLEKKNELALKNFEKAFKVIPKVEYSDAREIEKLYYYGKLDFENGNYKESIRKLNSIDSIKLKELENRSIFFDDFYKILYKSYINIGENKRAEYYFDKHLSFIQHFHNLSDSVKSKISKIEKKEFSKELKMVKTKNRKQRSLMAVGLFLFITLIFVFIYYFQRVKKNNLLKYNTLITKIESKQTKVVKAKTKINNIEVDRVIKNLKKLEQKEFYLNQDCSLVTTAKAVNTNSSYLSKIVNTHFNKTFNSYINDLRIKSVLIRLREDHLFRKYTIHSIANEIGFKSKESFNKAFKKETGILPSFYIKRLELKS